MLKSSLLGFKTTKIFFSYNPTIYYIPNTRYIIVKLLRINKTLAKYITINWKIFINSLLLSTDSMTRFFILIFYILFYATLLAWWATTLHVLFLHQDMDKTQCSHLCPSIDRTLPNLMENGVTLECRGVALMQCLDLGAFPSVDESIKIDFLLCFLTLWCGEQFHRGQVRKGPTIQFCF